MSYLDFLSTKRAPRRQNPCMPPQTLSPNNGQNSLNISYPSVSQIWACGIEIKYSLATWKFKQWVVRWMILWLSCSHVSNSHYILKVHDKQVANTLCSSLPRRHFSRLIHFKLEGIKWTWDAMWLIYISISNVRGGVIHDIDSPLLSKSSSHQPVRTQSGISKALKSCHEP